MNKRTQQELIGWAKRYIDDVTTIMINDDIVSLYVNGKRIGIITHQRIG